MTHAPGMSSHEQFTGRVREMPEPVVDPVGQLPSTVVALAQSVAQLGELVGKARTDLVSISGVIHRLAELQNRLAHGIDDIKKRLDVLEESPSGPP